MVFCVILSACANMKTPNAVPRPFIGEIVSVELLFGDPYNKNWAAPKNSLKNGDINIIVSNACGYAKASFQNLNVDNPKPHIIATGQTIGEWCRNPYEEIRHHETYLIVPLAKNDNRAWQHGSYKGAVLKLFDTPSGRYADILKLNDLLAEETQLLEAGQPPKSELELFKESILALGFQEQVEILPSPAIIRELDDGEDIEFYGIEKDLYAIKDNQLLLIKGLRIDSYFKD